MDKLPNTCLQSTDKRSVAVAYENGKKYTLNNQSSCLITHYRVDGCFPQPPNERRCDYLFLTEHSTQPKQAFFVELKGSALSKAIRQLHDTLRSLDVPLKGYETYARIVGSSDVPRLKETPHYKMLAKKLSGTRRQSIIYRTNQELSETI